jgi:hypothetical protein
VGFSLEGYGAGYSSLSYMKQLPLDEVKIARSFGRDVCTSAADAAGHARTEHHEVRFHATGAKLHTTFTRKNGREYRYSVCKAEKQFGAAAKTCERIPADAIESASVAQIKTLLGSLRRRLGQCAEYPFTA